MELIIATLLALALGVIIGFFWGYETHVKDLIKIRKELKEPE